MMPEGAMPMITLKSHAIPASPFNSERVTYYRGKPETTVVGECGIRDRAPNEKVHLVDPVEGHRYCYACGQWAGVWYDREDKWQDHPMRCR